MGDIGGDTKWLAAAVGQRANAFADQLRGVTDGSTPIPSMQWSVSDLGQHVLGLPGFWSDQNDNGSEYERPQDFSAFVEDLRAQIVETEPTALANNIEAAFGNYVAKLSAAQNQLWLYGSKTDAPNMLGLCLNELILHGRDLATVTGAEQREYDRREANAAVKAMMVTTPAFIDETKARAQPDGVYHVRFRGGSDYTWTKSGGQLTIEIGKPKRADAHLNADPATFLLASFGRIGQVRAGMSGKMVTYGRRPWRFLGLGTMAIDGV